MYDGFYKNCLYNGFSYELLVCDGFLCILFPLKLLLLVWKGVFWDSRKYAFLIFEKAMSKKSVSEIFRFVSMLFNVIINVIIF